MTNIQWTDSTKWNPVVGCSRTSPGCTRCYAERMAWRLENNPQVPRYDGVAKNNGAGPRWTGRVRLIKERLDLPQRWKKPRRIFANSMSDFFHEALTFDDMTLLMEAMDAAGWHTFQVLTKRAGRLADFAQWYGEDFPPNVWIGVSVENQEYANRRIPHLLAVPATVRFLSCEPLLGPVDLEARRGSVGDDGEWVLKQALGDARPLWACPNCQGARYQETDPYAIFCDACGGTGSGLDWVIVGGESGPGARPMDVRWMEDIVNQCREAGVPVFVKQLGADPYCSPQPPRGGTGYVLDLKDSKGGDMHEWPEHLRIREFPGRQHEGVE